MNEEYRAKERGQSLVLVAGAMVVLVMFVAIAVDLSGAYYARRTAQNAADGAALAGVARMATGINKKNPKLDDDIMRDMNDFAERNGIEDTNGILKDEVNDNVEGWYVDTEGNRLPGEPMVGVQEGDDVPEGAYGIEAITHIAAPAFFGGIFGLDGYPIQARAVSLLRQACSSDCIIPVTTDISLLSPDEAGQCFNIFIEKQRPHEAMTPGLLGWVNWTWQMSMCTDATYGDGRPCPEVDQGENGCQVPVLGGNLNPLYCGSGFVQVGDWISAASGDMNANDVRCLLDYYLGIPHPIEECGVSSDVPRSFTIPVYDLTTVDIGGSDVPCLDMNAPYDPVNFPTESGGGLHYRVAGFARMQLLGYQLSQGIAVPDALVFNPDTCVTHGVVPNDGVRISAEFIEWVEDASSSDECFDPSGTLLSAPRLTE